MTKTPNLNPELIKIFEKKLGLLFLAENADGKKSFSPENLLDYIYAVLHSPKYRETYKEFLKIDFPKIPYPANPAKFWQLVKLGGEIRELHLLESTEIDSAKKSPYCGAGHNIVGKVRFEEGKVYINETQYFDEVSEISWSFYIGGYQPARKWLKDRKSRELKIEDIEHYQEILISLAKTEEKMKEIDEIMVI